MELSTVFVEGGLLTAEALKHRKDVGRWWGDSWRALRRGTYQIAIFGAQGTGKTSLSTYLSGYEPIPGVPYGESLGTEHTRLKGVFHTKVSTVAGGERYVAADWQQLIDDISKKKRRLLTNVVAYGYHAIRLLEPENVFLYKQGMTQEEFVEVYSEHQRREEITRLEDLSQQLNACKGTLRMVTLITKQDLWWHKRAEVNEFYSNGEYNAIIQRIMERKGKEHFVHAFVSASLVRENWRTESGTVLARVCQGYDDTIREANRIRLKEVIAKMGRLST